jgi:hypothetical protein
MNTPTDNDPIEAMIRRDGHAPEPTAEELLGSGPRFRPCEKCGRSPALHNPHPHNESYVGHEYV